MPRADEAADEPVAVTVHAAGLLGADLGAVGVGNARIMGQPRRFAFKRQLFRVVGTQPPLVVEVEVREFRWHELGVG